MIAGLSLLAAVVLAALAALHLYWAFGSDSPSPAVIPTSPEGTPVLHPGPAASLGVAVLLLLAAFLLAERGGWGPGWVSTRWRTVGTASVAAVLMLRGIGDFRYVGLFKRHRDSLFARMDSRFYTPLVLTLAAIAGFVALRGR